MVVSSEFRQTLRPDRVRLSATRMRPVKKRAFLPLAFTLGNAICGFAALTYAARVPRGMDFYNESEIYWLWLSGWFIIGAMVLDGLDGRMARLTRSASEFGTELDSVCDAISFGVAPGFLLLKLSAPEALPIQALWAIAVFYVLCVASRLARFNTQHGLGDSAHERFVGLPSPAAAGVVAGVALVRHQLHNPTSFLGRLVEFFEWEVTHVEHLIAIGLPLTAIVLGLLMISRVPYPHATNRLLSPRSSWKVKALLISVLLVGVAVLREFVIPLVFAAYSFGSPVLSAVAASFRHRRQAEQFVR
jgi:CDP-diacylglycerol--serine O-phosphatidyltransferase